MSDPAALQIAESLREAIITGALAPGERLREVALATQFSTSRVPVREALRELTADGYVELRPNAGARVAQTTAADVQVLFDMRIVLEASLARSAAEGAPTAPTSDDAAEGPGGGVADPARDAAREAVREILAAGDAAIAAGDNEQLAALNLRFHNALGLLSGRTGFTGLLRQLTGRTQWLHSLTPAHLHQRGDAAWHEHWDILAHIESGEADRAAALMTRHLERSRDALMARHRGATA